MVAKRKQLWRNDLGLALALVLGALLCLHVVGVTAEIFMPGSLWARLAPWIDLDREHNLPTTVTSGIFVLASYYCVRLADRTKQTVQKVGWIFFGLLFTYFALDEFLIIHEQLAAPVRSVLNISAGNPLFHAWVVPVAVVVMIGGIGVIVIREYYKQLAFFSGLLTYIFFFVTGVVAIEIAGTYVYDSPLIYRYFMIPLEEIFELTMASVLVLKLHDLYTNERH